jgi:hypothetical protein
MGVCACVPMIAEIFALQSQFLEFLPRCVCICGKDTSECLGSAV